MAGRTYPGREETGAAVYGLGSLESKVMDVLWDDPETALPGRDVIDRLAAHPAPAYTTVKTVLDNLVRKGYVQRSGSHRRYRYVPAVVPIRRGGGRSGSVHPVPLVMRRPGRRGRVRRRAR